MKRGEPCKECGKPSIARGLCSVHYCRWHRHGDVNAVRKQRPRCSVQGCDKPNFGKGLCNMHYSRQRKNGTTEISGTAPGEARDFYETTVKVFTGDECLLWPFSTKGPEYRTGKGYPQLHIDGKLHAVHRLVCEMANGVAPSDIHQAAHSCGNSICVNPRHLRWATPVENMADTIAHGTRAAMGVYQRSKRPYKPRAHQNRAVIRSDGTMFSSIGEAASATGCNRSGISSACTGQRKRAGGFSWRYAEGT